MLCVLCVLLLQLFAEGVCKCEGGMWGKPWVHDTTLPLLLLLLVMMMMMVVVWVEHGCLLLMRGRTRCAPKLHL